MQGAPSCVTWTMSTPGQLLTSPENTALTPLRLAYDTYGPTSIEKPFSPSVLLTTLRCLGRCASCTGSSEPVLGAGAQLRQALGALPGIGYPTS